MKRAKKIIKQLRNSSKMHKAQAKSLEKLKCEEDRVDEKCWPGYKKKGMKTMFGKRYPNCVKANEEFYNRLGNLIYEEGLHAWFKNSRSKGGKPGWVQVVSGKPCARQPGQTSTPKCVSSAKRASMSKAERRSAQARKRRADPNQPQKSGAAKPTYVSTHKPKRKSK